jgi:hypothetical protein
VLAEVLPVHRGHGIELTAWVERGRAPGVRLTVTQGRHTLVDEAYGLAHIMPLIPWNRLHVNLAGHEWTTGISVSIPVAGTSHSGRVSSRSTTWAGPTSTTGDASGE